MKTVSLLIYRLIVPDICSVRLDQKTYFQTCLSDSDFLPFACSGKQSQADQ